MSSNQTPSPSDEEQLVHVGWWCWRGDNHGHLATQPCRSDNVPVHVPAEWVDEMRAVIQRIEDGDDGEVAPTGLVAVPPTTADRDRIAEVLAQKFTAPGFGDSLTIKDRVDRPLIRWTDGQPPKWGLTTPNEVADAVLGVLLAGSGDTATTRADVLRDFPWRLEQSAGDAAAEKFLDDNPELRRLADEAQQPDCDHDSQVIDHEGAQYWACMKCGTNLGRIEDEAQQQPETPGCPDPIECSHEAALGQAQEQVRRLGLMVDEYGAGASALTDKLKRVRDLHREVCPVAQGVILPPAAVCGLCEVLDAPASAVVSAVPPQPEETSRG